MLARAVRCLPAILLVALVVPAQAELKVHRLFSENGILQRGVKVPVWGTTDKPEPVTVKFGDQTVTATPADGMWKAELASLKESTEGKELTITQADKTITLKNVVVGDIWLCGGQSNMQWGVNESSGAAEAISAATNPNIRLFTVQREGDSKPRTELKTGDWVEASPTTIPGFTAVGYYFGRDLQTKLGVPIGLLSSNLGGTTAERWMDLKAIESNDLIKDMNATQGKSDLYNAMIAPLAPFAIKGAIWYQGESNADRPYNYRHVMAAMIANWRDTFGQGKFPFLIVELAPFMPIVDKPVDQEWAVVRESQQVAAKEATNADTVSLVDVGHETDIHPPDKAPVGARLAIAARALVYGEKIDPAGPEYDSVSFDGNKAIIKFKNVGGGLMAKDAVKGFTLAGEDKTFENATAKIEGNTVVVTSEKVAAPKAVRFGWANYPVVDLWNKEGLPAHPFRTDDWPVMKQDEK